jgi:hypothetical protein
VGVQVDEVRARHLRCSWPFDWRFSTSAAAGCGQMTSV